jgi:fructokinase
VICVVGEALVDVFTGPDGTVHESVGGSPLNLAVTLGRLDVPAYLITQLGDDDHGRHVREHLAASGVELFAAPAAQGRTSTASVRLDETGSAAYSFDLAWSLPGQELPACDVLHVGSLGAVLEPGRESVVDLVEQAWQRGVFVSYDPNVRAEFLAEPDRAWLDLAALAERAALVKVSSEDVALLHPGADPADIARTLLTGERTELVVVTDGAAGSTAYVEERAVHVPAPPVEVVDTVGAGDSFMAGLLTILFEDGAVGAHGPGMPHAEDGLDRLLRGAGQVAAITCSRRGADAPRRTDLPDGWPG